ncbi:Elongation factor P-like protein [hydrothermal vent metagenome]|uniref:Elongation factor P-like protein n=1 Tax=hydrothermal vent metagenome TaxID=652676 RepID=A0A3B0YAL5_9ZZZZ
MKANELKRGAFIQCNGQNIVIKSIFVQTASSRSGNTLYKIKGQVLVTKQKVEHNFKGDDNVDIIDVSRCAVQPLYREGNGWVFMDGESYEQHTLVDEDIQDELLFIMEGLEGINALVVEDQVMGIELPATVVLTIEETAPAMKAASSSARTKPATLTTGLVVQIPEYLAAGERIKVNTETREYVSRA